MSGLYTNLGGQLEGAKTVFYSSMWDEQAVQDVQMWTSSGAIAGDAHLKHAEDLVFHVFKKVMDLLLTEDNGTRYRKVASLPIDMRHCRCIVSRQGRNLDLFSIITDAIQVLYTIYKHPWGLIDDISLDDIPNARALFEDYGVLDTCLLVVARADPQNPTDESPVTIALRKACPVFHARLWSYTYNQKEIFEPDPEDPRNLQSQETLLLLLLAIKAAFMAVQDVDQTMLRQFASTPGWPQERLATQSMGIRKFSQSEAFTQSSLGIEWEERRKVLNGSMLDPNSTVSSYIVMTGTNTDGSRRSASIVNLVMGGEEIRSSAGLLFRYLAYQPQSQLVCY